MKKLLEYLVNNHTVKSNMLYDGDDIIDFMISLAGPKVEITKKQNKMFINTKKVRKNDGTPARWVYIWKYFWDNPGSTINQCKDALLDTAFEGNENIMDNIIDIAINNEHPSLMRDAYSNKYYTATHPKRWKAN